MALISEEFDQFFLQTVRALEPYLGDVVIAGGCANALYRFVPQAEAGPVPMITYDVDVIAPTKLPPKTKLLRRALEEKQLLPVESTGRTNKYALMSEANEKLEFLCPKTGLSRKMKEQAPTLVDFQEGTVAEALDFVQLLQKHPLSVDLKDVEALNVTESLPVLVPHPLRYVIQKALIRGRRRESSHKAKDSYYIYEITVLFRSHLNELAGQLEDLSSKRLSQAVRTLEKQFSYMSAEGVSEAVGIASEKKQNISPEAVLRATQRLIQCLKEKANSAE